MTTFGTTVRLCACQPSFVCERGTNSRTFFPSLPWTNDERRHDASQFFIRHTRQIHSFLFVSFLFYFAEKSLACVLYILLLTVYEYSSISLKTRSRNERRQSSFLVVISFSYFYENEQEMGITCALLCSTSSFAVFCLALSLSLPRARRQVLAHDHGMNVREVTSKLMKWQTKNRELSFRLQN